MRSVSRLAYVAQLCNPSHMADTAPLSTRDAAKRLNVAVATINRWAKDGDLSPILRAPGKRGANLFDPADVEALAVERAK